MRHRLYHLIAYGGIAAWAAVVAYMSISNPTIAVSDMFDFIKRADHLSLRNAQPWMWVNGIYPLGYPVLLRTLFVFTGDYEVAGKVLSLLFGSLGLVVIYRTCVSLFVPSVAVLAILFCGTNPIYLRYSACSGTDIPACVLLMCGAYLLCRFQNTNRQRYLASAGAAFGAAYLIRYTALTVLPAVLLWLWFQSKTPERWSRRLSQSLFFLGAFVLVASPQLILSAVYEGNPFYNTQVENVNIGVLGDLSQPLTWKKAAMAHASLFELVSLHPREFLSNWARNLWRVVRTDFLPFPFTLVSFAGFLFSLRPRQSRAGGFLFLLLSSAFTVSHCIAHLQMRNLLFINMVLSIFVAVPLFVLVPGRLQVSFLSSIPVRSLSLAALAVWLLWTSPKPDFISEYDRSRINVSKALASRGVSRSSEVLSFSPSYYDLRSPTKDRFSGPWGLPGFRPYDSLGDIALRMRREGRSYLVFDNGAPRNVPGLEAIWPFWEDEMDTCFEHVASFFGPVHIYRLKDLPTEEAFISWIENAKSVFELYGLEKSLPFVEADPSRAKADLDRKRKQIFSEKTPIHLLDGIYLVDFQFKRQYVGYKGVPDYYYKVSVIFWAEKQPEKDYAVQWHGHVDREHAKLLPQLMSKKPYSTVPWSGNNVMWSFRGPAKSDWNKGDYILVRAGVNWPELPYNLFLALAPYGGGRCSPFINLGWAGSQGD